MALLDSGLKIFKSALRVGESRNATKVILAWQGVFAGATLLSHKPAHEKVKALGSQFLTTWLTLGMASPVRQVLWSVGLSMAPAFGSMMKGINQGYRRGLEERTSAAIPFSHSTINMDMAIANLSYAQHSMGEANSIPGQSAIYAAKFLSR